MGIGAFAYLPGDINAPAEVRGAPTVQPGESLRFGNLDAAAQVFHTITACRAPCNRATGVSYPIADGAGDFDSGTLGYGPEGYTAAVQRAEWQTPRDLPPGTYTAAGTPVPRDGGGPAPAPGPAPGSGDTAPPAVGVGVRRVRLRALARGRPLIVRLRADEPVSATVRARVGRVRLAAVRTRVNGAARTTVRLRASRRARAGSAGCAPRASPSASARWTPPGTLPR